MIKWGFICIIIWIITSIINTWILSLYEDEYKKRYQWNDIHFLVASGMPIINTICLLIFLIKGILKIPKILMDIINH